MILVRRAEELAALAHGDPVEPESYPCYLYVGQHGAEVLTARDLARMVKMLKIKPVKPLRVFKPVNQVSRRQAKVERARMALKGRLSKLRGNTCQAKLTGVCTHWVRDMHEIKSRGQRGDTMSPKNCLLVCRECHEWVTKHPAEAERLGLSKRTGLHTPTAAV